jgi:hypothetical protein
LTLEGLALERLALPGATVEGLALEGMALLAFEGPTCGVPPGRRSVAVGSAAFGGSPSGGEGWFSSLGISTPSNFSMGTPSSTCSM